ncbi:MAG: hypothetical protein LBC88_08190 [Spirochaetaceae bacterium]|jgi:hypothetical protein|nr:hypothetical protein [Spirochaetaceae bacterium]
MAQEQAFQNDLDPEIAALLDPEITGGISVAAERDMGVFPGPDGDTGENSGEEDAGGGVDLAEQSLPKISKKLEAAPSGVFSDAAYYKTALSGEGDSAQRIHGILQKYIATKDPKDRTVFRQQITTAYWDFFGSVAKKASGKIPDAKKFLLRFNILHPTLLQQEQRDFFGKIIVDNNLGVPLYYLDEWFRAVGTGEVRPSTTDEGPVAGKGGNTSSKLTALLEKARGRRDGAKSLLASKNEERNNLERALQERVTALGTHNPLPEFPGINGPYTESQKRAFAEMQELSKQMLKSDRELETLIRDFMAAGADVKTLESKVEEEGGAKEVDTAAVDAEFGTIRQMAKMTIGRQGNHFPVCTGEYFRSGPNDVATRENVVSVLSWIESVDTEAFHRVYRSKANRIVPFVILIPCYGDTGVCWEPFDRYNRATSRGRIAVPMYPKNLAIAILSAVADLRWQVAKEKASFYWMEEGLTGNYYQWFTAHKLKGDIKEYFIQDYITWMTKESEGTQKLDKEMRGIFWRFMPFSQPVKEKLKGRSFAYQELYQRDLNRAMSDGY